ncbi:MAG: excinuclease ABC subunit UvrC [Pseudomonadota bacterium]
MSENASHSTGPNNQILADIARDGLGGTELIAAYVKTLPNKPGVYRMLDEEETPLYVGKARDLKKRVTSYTKLMGQSNRIARMITATKRMEFILTASETEALLLEANLIKQLRPKYNVLLRDDKSFPYILIATDHAAPQALKHRGARKRKGHYFGPFASAGAVNRTLNTLQKAFLLRSCSDSVYDARSRPCLLYQIKRCSAPCVDYVDEPAYGALVKDAVDFLQGRNSDIQASLSRDMEAAAEALDFERAAALRDRIKALTAVQQSQGINPQTLTDADVFAIHSEGGQSCVQVFFFRSGQNWGNHAYFPRHDKEETLEGILDAFLAQFYDGKPPPKLILTNVDVPNAALLSEALTLKAERTVVVTRPQRGEKRELTDQATVNAREALSRRLSESATQRKLLNGLAETLGLDAAPERIEVYDNSHIQGANAVGGMIVAGPEGFEKNQYRKFNIKDKDLSPGDDFGMMREVLNRRFSRLLKEDADGAAAWPDLIVIDGGQGQLTAAEDVFRELGVENVALASIAKPRAYNERGEARPDRTMGAVGERVFQPGKPVVTLQAKSPVLYFLQRLRDEAHRYAIGAHRAKRKKDIAKNPLDDIAGVGPARKRALLNHFGSAKAVSRAKPQDLAAVEGVSEAMAQKIYDFFHAEG